VGRFEGAGRRLIGIEFRRKPISIVTPNDLLPLSFLASLAIEKRRGGRAALPRLPISPYLSIKSFIRGLYLVKGER
jgi:hypothetical protein